MAILLLVSRSNQIEDLAPIVPAALTALESILPGQVVRIGEWSSSDCLYGAPSYRPTSSYIWSAARAVKLNLFRGL